MKKLFLLISLFAIAKFSVYAQSIYHIDDFMDGYTLYYSTETYMEENDEGEDEQVIDDYYILIRKSTGEPVLEHNPNRESLKLYFQQNKANASKTSYKSLDDIHIHLLEDFNFDDVADILITGTKEYDEGCYTPSRDTDIYLSVGGKFEYSSSLSGVYNGALCYRGGHLYPKKETQQLIAVSSGGAAYHGVNIYEMDGLECKQVGELIEDGMMGGVFIEVTGWIIKDGKPEDVKWKTLYDDKDEYLSFSTKNKKGSILLFQEDGALYYTFTRPDGYISFAHPAHADKAKKAQFKFTNKNNEYTLEFNSGTVKYTIYESGNSIGIKINVNGKLSDWDGVLSTKKGSLRSLKNKQLINVVNL